MPRIIASLTLALALCGASAAALAEDAVPAAKPAVAVAGTVAAATSTAPATATAATTAPVPEDNASLYCRNIANAAADARYARQADALAALEKQLEDRMAKLEAKRAEYEDWVKKREDFLAKADGAVVAIYSQMRPDAAAQQFAAMEPDAAAAILAKLSPRTASAILNEMDAGIAANLTNVMAGLPQPVPKDVAKPG